MKKYDFDSFNGIWKDHARSITSGGVFVAHESNWDLWIYNGMIYSIACAGSGASCSTWCNVSDLRKHLYYLRNVCGYASLIPPGWENVNNDLLIQYGIN